MTAQYDREQLLTEVWSEPVLQVAPRYGLSDVGLKKLCARLQIPTPTRGHWAKLKAGKRVPSKPVLRAYTGHPCDLYMPPRALAARLASEVPEVVDPRLQKILDYEQDPAHRIVVPERLTRPHPYIGQTRDALKSPFIDQRNLPVPRGKALDIKVSTAMLPRSLRIADALIKAFEKRGYAVSLNEHSTQVNILGVNLSFSFFEPATRSIYEPTAAELAKQARGQWVNIPKWTYSPSGRLQLIGAGKVADSSRSIVDDQLNNFVVMLARQVVDILLMRERQAIEKAERRRKCDEALAMQARQDAERSKLQELEENAHAWRRSSLLREYLGAFEIAASKTGGLSTEQRDYLAWAHAKADWLDPLVKAPDELLDLHIEIPRQYG